MKINIISQGVVILVLFTAMLLYKDVARIALVVAPLGAIGVFVAAHQISEHYHNHGYFVPQRTAWWLFFAGFTSLEASLLSFGATIMYFG